MIGSAGAFSDMRRGRADTMLPISSSSMSSTAAVCWFDDDDADDDAEQSKNNIKQKIDLARNNAVTLVFFCRNS